jgi:hypothetical protein
VECPATTTFIVVTQVVICVRGTHFASFYDFAISVFF